MSERGRPVRDLVFRPYQVDPDLYATCLVAEIGTAHGGDAGKARELIDAAADAGADCAKFQMVYADEIVHPRTGTVELPGGATALYERFRSVERPPDFYAALKEQCEARGMLFLCTAFGERSARELHGLGIRGLKIASPELNHLPLLGLISSLDLPVVLSSGVSKLADIEQALEITGRERSILLHCVTAYPAPEEEYNLSLIRTLGDVFGVSTGVSDHSRHPELVPALATTVGARMVEKHFTLERNGGELDDPIALEPGEFRRLSGTVRRVEEILRLGGEDAIVRIEDEFAKEFTAERVRQVLGDGVKRLAPSETQYYGRTNRSIHALRELNEGETVNRKDVALLRTEQNLRPGLPPAFLESVIGATVRRPVPEGEGIRFQDLTG